RSYYLEFVGQEDAAFEELRRISEQTASPVVMTRFATALCRRDRYQEAFEFVERRRREPGNTDHFGVTVAYMLIELPDGPARALKFYQQAAARMLTGGGEPLSPYTILLLLGRKEEAVAASREIRKRTEQLPSARADWQRRLLDYDCELISEDELLNAAS